MFYLQILNVGFICEISSSHGSEYEAQNLLGCTALMMEVARTSEMSVDIQLRT
jgi:hypothetical protein